MIIINLILRIVIYYYIKCNKYVWGKLWQLRVNLQKKEKQTQNMYEELFFLPMYVDQKSIGCTNLSLCSCNCNRWNIIRPYAIIVIGNHNRFVKHTMNALPICNSTTTSYSPTHDHNLPIVWSKFRYRMITFLIDLQIDVKNDHWHCEE